MPVLRIPTPLRSYTDGQSEIPVQGGTVAEAMSDLMGQYPALQPHLYNGDGDAAPVRQPVCWREQRQRPARAWRRPSQADDRLLLIPSIAGG